MGIMDKLLDNEAKFSKPKYETKEKDKRLINNYFGLTKENQHFNMTVNFLGFEGMFGDEKFEGIFTRKTHYAIFSKFFKEKYDLEEIKTLGEVADTVYHKFADYSILNDAMWSMKNAHDATKDPVYDEVKKKINSRTESYCYIYVIDCSNPELVGKVWLYRIPQGIKNDYVTGKYNKFKVDVFESDDYCRIDTHGLGQTTKHSAVSDESPMKSVPFKDILKKNGQTIKSIKEDMIEIDITRYDFNADEELEKMEKIEEVFAERMAPLMSVFGEYSRQKLKNSGTKAVNTRSASTFEDEDTSDEPQPFLVEDDEDDVDIF